MYAHLVLMRVQCVACKLGVGWTWVSHARFECGKCKACIRWPKHCTSHVVCKSIDIQVM